MPTVPSPTEDKTQILVGVGGFFVRYDRHMRQQNVNSNLRCQSYTLYHLPHLRGFAILQHQATAKL